MEEVEEFNANESRCKKMKMFWKIAFLLIVVLLVIYYTDDRVKENKLLESPVKQITALPETVIGGLETIIPQTSRPETGLSTFVGEHTEQLIDIMGKPERIEPSGYDYDWWVYLGDLHFMVGVTKDNRVNQVYTADISSDVTPFEIKQNISDIYRFTIVNSEINVPIDENIYTFSLNSEDMQNRLLVIYDNLYVQLYVDQVDGELEGVRFIDPITLVHHQPYDMTFIGEVLKTPIPSSVKQIEVDRTAERQIVEITNTYRKKHGVGKLEEDYYLKIVARQHSQNMALENYASFEQVETTSLTDRLKEAKIDHRRAGENIALNYVDAIEAVHGWINSPAHRNVLLASQFTNIGAGVYGKVYTQNLIQLNKEDNRQRH